MPFAFYIKRHKVVRVLKRYITQVYGADRTLVFFFNTERTKAKYDIIQKQSKQA